MHRSRIDHFRRKREFERARRDHLADPPAHCHCPWCLGPDEVHRILMERARASAAAIGEPPF